MNQLTAMLIRSHAEYAKDHPDELEGYETVFDHMYDYFTIILKIGESAAASVIDEFRAGLAS
ncbi:hypothetical protein BG53_06965 [Paenibacillus darwinianus]|uniref:Uncharacterized protein n=1 Tax=Paenibacillus darwinianus TaxID=1380763 RepID=A0A9W5S027_9BACL|nr:hypothetical protein [Paenibacillus darwinianus]EXX86039.1 hypothetical protein CH50_08110 [Paenibacillus darwinianus]EXX86169.1 hypothetical protein BG53_06965 [Paenibacillus darwinianus]EXX86488.1 hypothetical protein BG52_06415 [Paenibacillus darwinianus]